MERPSTGKRRSREATPSDRLESSSATMVNFAAETDDDDDDDAFPPTPLARRAPPVTTLLDLPPEMLMEVVQRVGDARALAAAACSCRALRDAAEDRAAWSSAFERALPGVPALIETSPPDWALEKEKKKKKKKKRDKSEEEKKNAAARHALKHPRLLLAALASGKEFRAQVFNRELDNEAEDFLMSCYDAKLSLERWRPSAGDDDGEGEEHEEEEGGDAAAAAAPAAGVLTRARAAATAAAAAAAALSSPSSSFGECPRSPRLTRRRRRPEEEKAVAAEAAAAASAVAAVVPSSSRSGGGGPPASSSARHAAMTPELKRKKSSSNSSKKSPPGLPLRGISPTYTARYLPMGRSLAVETGVGAGRVRAAPGPGPPLLRSQQEDGGGGGGSSGGGSGGRETTPLSSPASSSAFSLSPGDAVEVQWKAMESHPYGSWLGCVVSVFSPEGSGAATTTAATANDGEGQGNRNNASALSPPPASTVDILFQQYSSDSPWQVVYSVPLLPPGSNVDSPVNGDPTFGFVGGVRGPLSRGELERWEGAWRSAEAAAVARGRARPARALSAGLPVAPPPQAPSSPAAPPALVS